jgi:hypothetical protein
VQKGTHFNVGHRAATADVDGNTVASYYDSADMNRNLRENCLKIMKEKEMSDAEVVPDLQPLGRKPNALLFFNLLKH